MWSVGWFFDFSEADFSSGQSAMIGQTAAGGFVMGGIYGAYKKSRGWSRHGPFCFLGWSAFLENVPFTGIRERFIKYHASTIFEHSTDARGERFRFFSPYEGWPVFWVFNSLCITIRISLKRRLNWFFLVQTLEPTHRHRGVPRSARIRAIWHQSVPDLHGFHVSVNGPAVFWLVGLLAVWQALGVFPPSAPWSPWSLQCEISPASWSIPRRAVSLS